MPFLQSKCSRGVVLWLNKINKYPGYFMALKTMIILAINVFSQTTIPGVELPEKELVLLQDSKGEQGSGLKNPSTKIRTQNVYVIQKSLPIVVIVHSSATIITQKVLPRN